jgi:hypothetical protein
MTITPIAWRMIYRLMDNVKSVMDDVYEDKNGEITNEDVEQIYNYITDSIIAILKQKK